MDDTTFRIEIQKLLVEDRYWSQFPWMNNATGTEIIVEDLTIRIKKHPLLWKLFFMLTR